MDRGMPEPPPPRQQQQREEYASEQVKDLLELYFRDPYAFDQYARTYYYGERSERSAAVMSNPAPSSSSSGGRGYYEKRPDV